MPNWCSNTLSISHKEPAMMQRFVEAYKAGGLFNEFVPNPDGKWDYGWSVENWGTKWDLDGSEIELNEDGSAEVYFDTAWSPPIAFYEKMADLGFDIDATYMESGIGFAGTWDGDVGDDCYEYDFSDEDWRDKIDNEKVIDMLEGEYEVYLEWKELEEEEA